jgi:hypothetical protein
MLRHVAIVRTNVSEERSASIIRAIRVGELGTLAVASNRRTLPKNNFSICHLDDDYNFAWGSIWV